MMWIIILLGSQLKPNVSPYIDARQKYVFQHIFVMNVTHRIFESLLSSITLGSYFGGKTMHFRIIGSAALLAAALIICPGLQAAEAAAAKAEAKAETAEAKPAAAEAKAEDGRKSPGVAGGLAFFPGMAVHGTGHMYAGSWMKGLGLLAVEGVSAYFIADTVVNGRADIEKISQANKGIPVDVSAGYTKIGILTVSTMAFLWSWFDDMAGAPIAVAEYNKLQDEAVAQIRVSPREDGAAVALSTDF
jgi:hypothetical protein